MALWDVNDSVYQVLIQTSGVNYEKWKVHLGLSSSIVQLITCILPLTGKISKVKQSFAFCRVYICTLLANVPKNYLDDI